MIGMYRFDRQQEAIRTELDRRVATVLEHKQFIAGPEVEEIEQALSNYVGETHTVTCASGTDALILALKALGVGPGDAVFVPSLTFIASASAVASVGATPVFVDIERDTLTLSLLDLERKLESLRRSNGPEPKAVIAVDLFGVPADYPRIAPFCAEESLFLIADAAQSFGATMGSSKVGNLAPITCLSFYPTKGLGCYGDGGAVMTADEELASHLRSLRWHGTDHDRRVCRVIGLNSRLDTLQAAILLAKIRRLDAELAHRRRVAQHYIEALQDPGRVQRAPSASSPSYGYFCLLTDDPDGLSMALSKRNIASVRYYAQPLHSMPAFRAAFGGDHLPETERCSRRLLTLPIDGYIDDEEIAVVCEALRTEYPIEDPE